MLNKCCKIIFILVILCSAKVISSQLQCANGNCIDKLHDRRPGESHHTSCMIQITTQEQGNIALAGFNSTNPKFLNVDKMWYVYWNSTSQHSQIALNISCILPISISLDHSKSYTLVVQDQTKNLNIAQVFNISNNVSASEVIEYLFSYDCIGKTKKFSISPGDKIMIKITSNPYNNNTLRHYFTIPSCLNPVMRKTFECQKQVPFVNIQKGCSNRVKTLKYNIPESDGDTVNILLCQAPSESYSICEIQVQFEDNLPLSGTFDFKLPEKFSTHQSYVMQIWGSDNYIRNQRKISFKDCTAVDIGKNENPENSSELGFPLELIAAIIAFVVILMVLLFVVITTVRRRKQRGKAETTVKQGKKQISISSTPLAVTI